MVKIIKLIMIFAVGFLFISSPVNASNEIITYSVTDSHVEIVTPQGTTNIKETQRTDDETIESIFTPKNGSLAFSHFTWGAEIGSSLDLTSHDLSTFDADVVLGYKNKYLKLFGIGAGVHRSIHTGNIFIPVYGVLRTSFRSKPSLLFLNLQAGYSFNTISDYGTHGDFSGALGLGINLKETDSFKSYILVSLAYQYFNDANKMMMEEIDTNYIFYARLSLGINF